MNIVVTGFNGSGSSTVCKLLKEYKTVNLKYDNYEHVLFYSPDGLMDLERSILSNDTILSSDEALYRFRNLMDKLYFNDFGWTGGYKDKFGKEFYNLYDNFIKSLIDFEFEGVWFGKLENASFSITKTLKDLVKFILSKKINNFGKRINTKNNSIQISFKDEKELDMYISNFIENYMNYFSNEKYKFTLFDHLIKPNNISLIDRYFDDNTKFIVVKRDLRDLYLYGKYIRKNEGNPSKFPKQSDEFLKFWEKVDSMESKDPNSNVLTIYLEELYYDESKTIEKLENFLGLSNSDRINKGKYFSKSKLRETMELYQEDKYVKEVTNFEKEFPNWVYYNKER